MAIRGIFKNRFRINEKGLWLDFIISRSPKKKRLNVLDKGAGPGFFTIILTGLEMTA